jgi:hypothetical protein
MPNLSPHIPQKLALLGIAEPHFGQIFAKKPT